MSIKIITDSAADYEQQELADKDIICVPLAITWGSTTYLDGFDLSKQEFYKKLQTDADFPKTSQPSPDAFLQHFKAAKENGDTVIAILLASALSGTYQSACIARNMAEYDQIFVIDSSNAAISLRVLVDTAVSLRDQGAGGPLIASEIEALKARTKLYAMPDTLEYLHRGGRLTKTQAKIGELTRLKPVITINPDGSLSVIEKCLGKGRAYKKLLSLFDDLNIDTDYPVYFVYSHEKDNCEKFVSLLKESHDFVNPSFMYNIGPTIGTHVGIGAFGFCCIQKEI